MRTLDEVACSSVGGGEHGPRELGIALAAEGGLWAVSASSGVTGGACGGIAVGGNTATVLGIIPVGGVIPVTFGAAAFGTGVYIGYNIGQQTGFHDWAGEMLAPLVPNWLL